MLKTGLGFQSSKPTKKNTVTLSQPNTILFLTPKAKEFFQKLKKPFSKESILQYFNVSKLIRLETDASEITVGGILYHQDTDKNWYLIAYYLLKMPLAEQNYETHDAELLAIIENFKT